MTLLLNLARYLFLGLVMTTGGAGLFLTGLGLGLEFLPTARPAAEAPPAAALTAEPILGLQFETVPAGALVWELAADSRAAQAGLRVGDVIQSVNGVRVDTAHTLTEVIVALHTQGRLTLGLWREGAALELEVELFRARDEVHA